MTWKNRAKVYGLRLCKYEEDLFYEIGTHSQFGCLVLDTENTKKGERESIKPYSAKGLIEKFPDLAEFEGLLYAKEESCKLNSRIRDLKKTIEELRNIHIKSKDIEEHIKGQIYSDEEFEIPCELFEDWSEDSIKKEVSARVQSLRRFLTENNIGVR